MTIELSKLYLVTSTASVVGVKREYTGEWLDDGGQAASVDRSLISTPVLIK